MAVLIALALLYCKAGDQLRAQELPDLVISKIFVASTPKRFENEDVVFVGTTVRNQGSDVRGEISVSCSFACRGDSQRFFSTVQLLNGLASQDEANVFDKTPLDMNGCFFSSKRQFTCMVDESDSVEEFDEANNSLSKMLSTGK